MNLVRGLDTTFWEKYLPLWMPLFTTSLLKSCLAKWVKSYWSTVGTQYWQKQKSSCFWFHERKSVPLNAFVHLCVKPRTLASSTWLTFALTSTMPPEIWTPIVRFRSGSPRTSRNSSPPSGCQGPSLHPWLQWLAALHSQTSRFVYPLQGYLYLAIHKQNSTFLVKVGTEWCCVFVLKFLPEVITKFSWNAGNFWKCFICVNV